MKADKWLWKLVLVFSILEIATGALSLITVISLDASRMLLTEKYARAIALAGSLRYLQAEEDQWALRVVLSADPNVYNELLNARKKFEDQVALLRTVDDSEMAKNTLDTIMARRRDLAGISEDSLTARLAGQSLQLTHQQLENKGRETNLAVVRDLDDFTHFEAENLAKERSKADALIYWLGLALVLSFVLLGLLFGVVIILFRKLEKSRSENIAQSQALAVARKEILEMVAHDLKNPLGAVKMTAEIMRETPDSAIRDVDELLEITVSSANSMENLISDLLDHSKIESGNLILECVDFDMSELLTKLIARYRLSANARDISLSSNIPSSLYTNGDPKRLEQVVSNLLSNAVKFTHAGGSVRVLLEDAGSVLRLSVADTGPGLTSDECKHIFERYWQVKTTASKGTGLGLSIAKSIVERHHGKLYVESSPGKGACFFIQLKKLERLATI